MLGFLRGKRGKQGPPLRMYDILLDWAWDEIQSPKWTERFIKDAGEEHVLRIRQLPSPSALSLNDQQILIEAFLNRRGWMIDKYLRPATDFREVSLDVAALGNLLIISEMSAPDMNMRHFASDEKQARGDPRHPWYRASALLQQRPDFIIERPPVILKTRQCPEPLLLEGYTRVTALLRRHLAGEVPSTHKVRCYCATNDAISDKKTKN